jgi:hypothetical protein
MGLPAAGGSGSDMRGLFHPLATRVNDRATLTDSRGAT